MGRVGLKEGRGLQCEAEKGVFGCVLSSLVNPDEVSKTLSPTLGSIKEKMVGAVCFTIQRGLGGTASGLPVRAKGGTWLIKEHSQEGAELTERKSMTWIITF